MTDTGNQKTISINDVLEYWVDYTGIAHPIIIPDTGSNNLNLQKDIKKGESCESKVQKSK